MTKIELPYPPSVNHYWGQKGKIRFLTAKAKQFRQEVVQIILDEAKDIDYDGPVKLDITLYPPDKRKRDIDNTLKPILDALEHANVYTNDVNVHELSVRKKPFEGRDKARAEVGIKYV